MKRLIALMMCAVSLGATAQISYPFNPDADGNGFVGVSDILEGISTYDTFFSPEEIQVGDTMALSDWIPNVSFELQAKQQVIDSLISAYANLTGLLAMEEYLTTSGVCAINYSESNNPAYHYHIPSTCRHVNLVTYYYGGIETDAALRLPENGLFDGQIIEFVLNARTPLSPAEIKIEAWQDGQWVQVGALYYTGCDQSFCQGHYNYLTSTNERLSWTGSQWVSTAYSPQNLEQSQDP